MAFCSMGIVMNGSTHQRKLSRTIYATSAGEKLNEYLPMNFYSLPGVRVLASILSLRASSSFRILTRKLIPHEYASNFKALLFLLIILVR